MTATLSKKVGKKQKKDVSSKIMKKSKKTSKVLVSPKEVETEVLKLQTTQKEELKIVEAENVVFGKELEIGTGIKTKVVEQALEGVRHLEKQRFSTQSTKDLLEDEEEESTVYLQVSMVKVANLIRKANHVVRPVKLKVFLPNTVVNSSTDVLLITKDNEDGKDIRDDHTENLYHYQRKLKLCGAASHISEVITFRQLKVEFKEYEAKRHLANRTNVVLCDDTIVRRIPKFLGKHFYGKRKFPIPVNLKAKNLLSEVERCLRIQILYLPMKGNSGLMKIGCLNQSNKMIIENIQAAAQKMVKQFPGGWENIQGLYLKTERSKAVPFYCKIKSPNDIQSIEPKPLYKKEALSDEVTTARGNVYTVNPDNTVRFKGRYSEMRNVMEQRKEEALKKAEKQLAGVTSKGLKKSKRALKATDAEGVKKKKKKEAVDDKEIVVPLQKQKKASDISGEKGSKKKGSKTDKKVKGKEELDSDVEDEKRLNRMEVDFLKRLKTGAEEMESKNIPSDEEYDDWSEGSEEDLDDLGDEF